ncbi:hypothetical protein K2173_012281 [Erythroxylum novogranatense]|uniref:Large ribosomal subunit protein uL10-like insertion domain-containing protein n=1 Tax=Erythroxylum novogranatense TaxID=1862640 RepID=A0AAV8SCN6_9ROSI|nr:hypothetical protein K2173_012281 [Erythroxylum novogranatense]
MVTKGDTFQILKNCQRARAVGAPARVALVAPIDVVVPPGNTGLDPSQTSFFQVLNIPTKINKGTVEITIAVDIIKKGEKVGSSEAALLSKLGIRPFSYGLIVQSVYDGGSVFSPEVQVCVSSLSPVVSYPTIAAAPHMLINAYKNLLAAVVATDYSFPLAEKAMEYLKVCVVSMNVLLTALAPVAGGAGATTAVAPASATKEDKKEEAAEPEESVEDMVAGLLD